MSIPVGRAGEAQPPGSVGTPARRVLQAALHLPAVATPQVMGATTGGMYTAGGLSSLVATLNGGQVIAHLGALRSLSVLSIAIGVGVLLARRRIPRRAYHGLVLLGTAQISGAVWLAGQPMSLAVASLYVFVAIDLFFFSLVAAAAQVVVLLTGAGLAMSGGPVPVGARVVVLSATVSVAVVVGWLVRCADAVETDPLTGLLNRRGLDRALAEAMLHADSGTRPLALALVDLDHFEDVNDTLGHDAGDRLLVAVARAWEGALRSGCQLARVGGDEFALLLPDTGPTEAEALVERLRAAVPGSRTCSAGLAALDAGDSASLLVGRADAGLHEAKRSGRDRTARSGEQAAREHELRGALRRGELFLAYQPVVQLPGGRTVGMEALVRWHHPEHGVLQPGAFIPAAETSEVVHELGEWVLTRALADAALWRADHLHETGPPPTVAVNVAGPELRAPGYVQRFAASLEASGVPADVVVLEVTESTLDADSPGVVATLAELRGLGVHVALDDFGTGWSSLSRLDRLPVDILKIDQSFVEPLTEPGADPTMLRAVVAIGSALHLDVVAEGVETARQAAAVTAAGCGFAQGWHYGRPGPRPRVGVTVPAGSVPAGSVPAGSVPAGSVPAGSAPGPGARA